ncbi:hypothetical protein ACJQWK_05518 [Exserohilum turcicum]
MQPAAPVIRPQMRFIPRHEQDEDLWRTASSSSSSSSSSSTSTSCPGPGRDPFSGLVKGLGIVLDGVDGVL